MGKKAVSENSQVIPQILCSYTFQTVGGIMYKLLVPKVMNETWLDQMDYRPNFWHCR